jgi:Protoglobin
MNKPEIAGYHYGEVPRSPVGLRELKELEAAVGLTDEDRASLRRAGELLSDEAEALVDGWRAIIGSQPHLAAWFLGPDQRPDERYKAAVKRRFVRWIIDLFQRPFDQDWLDYQEEIGLRHTPAKKNLTDHAGTAPQVPLRFLIAFTAPVIGSLRPRLEAKGLRPDEVERVQAAWSKAVLLSIALWSRPYVKDGLW